MGMSLQDLKGSTKIPRPLSGSAQTADKMRRGSTKKSEHACVRGLVLGGHQHPPAPVSKTIHYGLFWREQGKEIKTLAFQCGCFLHIQNVKQQ